MKNKPNFPSPNKQLPQKVKEKKKEKDKRSIINDGTVRQFANETVK